MANYRKIKKCGSGAFSAVFQYQDIRHDSNGEYYAVKRMDKDIDRPSTQLMFFREVSILLALQHPAVLPFEGFTLPTYDEAHFQIVTKFMQNNTVQQHEDWDSEGRCNPHFDATTKSKIIYGSAVGMKFIHDNHIVHRDLKAENIFLSDDWSPVIADFGLSKQIEAELEMSGTMGTPYYMAPELFDTEGQKLSYPIDVYAYAIIVLSLFTKGQFRFVDSRIIGLPQLASGLAKGKRFDIPTHVPDGYKELITSCWGVDSDQRFTFEAVIEFLDRDIVAGGPPLVIPGTNIDQYNNYRKVLRDWRPDNAGTDQKPQPVTQPFAFPT
jgi:NIMA (never in mitosis gene a)-related kinase